MNRSILFLLSIISLNCFASQSLPNGNYWRCSSTDAESKEWSTEASYEIASINKALDDCKKQSNYPQTCKVSKESCEMIVNGVSTRPMWQCKALDQMAKVWLSNTYAHMEDAALAAKAYCQQHSGFPDTCFVNLMTCKNLR